MKKLLCLLCAFSIVVSAKSQHFEWAASMGKAQTETLSAVTDAEGNITMALSWLANGLNHVKYEEMYCVFDAFGDTLRLEKRNPAMLVVVQFNKQGKLNWHKSIIGQRNDYVAETAFLTCNKNGDVSFFMNAGGYYYVSDWAFESFLEDGDYKRNEATPSTIGDDADKDYDALQNEWREEWEGTIQIDFTKAGKLKRLSRIFSHNNVELQNVVADAKGGNILSGFVSEKSITIGKTTISGLTAGATVIIKTDSMGTVSWVQPIKYLAKSCCTIYDSKLTQAPNGTIFLAGRSNYGIEFTNGKKEEFETKPEHTQFNPPSAAFITALAPDGKYLWHKLSFGNSHITALLASNDNVYVSGVIGTKAEVFENKADTAVAKRSFIMTLAAKTGKTVWLQSNTGNGFVSLTIDNQGNVYGLGKYEAYRYGYPYDKPAYFHTDTLRSRWSSLIVASYDAKGNYRWVKSTTSVLFENSHYYRLFNDGCNNLFVAGSAFAGLKIPTQYLDGAFMKGEAYGSMAYVTKIKNNVNKLDTNVIASDSSKKQDNVLFAYREVQGDAIKGQTGCSVSPGPWTLTVFPNPFSADATVKISTTYNDDNVSVLVFDLKGQLLGTLLNAQKLEKGTYEYPLNASSLNLQWGTYLIVLRGSATILSERVIYK